MLEIFTSSKGHGLAMRWQATLLGVVPTVIAIGSIFGWDIPETFLIEAVQSFTFIAALMMFGAGWMRKRLNKENNLGKFK